MFQHLKALLPDKILRNDLFPLYGGIANILLLTDLVCSFMKFSSKFVAVYQNR